ncbi:hypothetical protein ACF3MZ_16875 [Paenibacillaceae bacterium WGS1546]|uniref:hypothetical protein n=1 Tax=Cohnella sp. WGS1546 TaxID=3366810 RepID=UPI00372D30B5
MNFVRKVTHSDKLKHFVDLPENLRDQDVELIILPLDNPAVSQPPTDNQPSARGALRKFANLDLVQYEQEAWKKGVQEKHEYR